MKNGFEYGFQYHFHDALSYPVGYGWNTKRSHPSGFLRNVHATHRRREVTGVGGDAHNYVNLQPATFHDLIDRNC